MKGMIAILIALTAAFALSQTAPPNWQVQFEKALALEEAQGKLQEAIALYQKIVDESKDQALAAQAQLRIGICHQKLGHKEAQNAFQKVIKNYPGQIETVRLAQEQLSLLGKAQDVLDKKHHEPTIRLVWGPEADTYGAPSPDGGYLSFVDWSTGDLAVRYLKTGKNRRLTNKGPWEKSSDEAGLSIWSPDGSQIAFEWLCDAADHPIEFRVMRLDGSQPRTLYSAGKSEWASLYDWSPDGKQILASLPGKKLSLISVADGSIRILKALERDSSKARFSPDGRYIIYDAPQSTDSLDRDIHVMSIQDAGDRQLVSHSADDSVLGWAPDGKFILFLSDRTGNPCFWLLPVSDGKADGNPQMIKAVSRRTVPLGFSRDGSFFYGESKDASDIYAVNFNPATGKVLGPPEKIINRFEGLNFSPSFSPDGKYLAYCSRRSGSELASTHGNVLCIHSMDSGEEKEFSKELRELGIRAITRPSWAPDGKSMAIYGYAKPMGGHGGIYVVNLQTGTVSEVLYSDNDVSVYHVGWSSDGKSIIIHRFDKKESLHRLVTRNLETGREKRLYEINASSIDLKNVAISPDFQQLCLLFFDRGQRVFAIMKASGGELRRLHEFPEQESPRWFTWAADGRHILFTRKDKAAGWLLWQLSVDSGEPELLALTVPNYRGDLSAHPDGKRIAFSVGPRSGAEIWVMENFLP
jgi:Tol biopolymer transport system component